MRKMKPSGKTSFLKSVLRALGMDKSFTPHAYMCAQTETQRDIPVSYPDYVSTRTALLKAEQARANAFMEIRKNVFFR